MAEILGEEVDGVGDLEALRKKNSELEEQVALLSAALLQKQSFEAVGQAAAGVAHDFNNLIMGIMALAESVETDLPHGEMKDDLGQIVGAARRASELSRILLRGTRGGRSSQVSDLNVGIQDALSFLKRLLPEDIELKTVLEPNLGEVRISRVQIDQIVTNLVVNARDALSAGGSVEIRTSRGHSPIDRLEDGLARPECAVLTVSDTGSGIDPEVAHRIFEPFFSTKSVKDGTGVGLASIHAIVKENGGDVVVSSTQKVGTTFHVYLPFAGAKIDVERRQGPRLEGSRTGDEIILLAEDDEMVRSVMARALEKCGYRVLAAADVEDAKRIVSEHGLDISLIISDVVMPKASGPTLVRELMKKCPQAQALFISGHAEPTLASRGLDTSEGSFIEKPFTMERLCAKVGEMLDDAGARPPV